MTIEYIDNIFITLFRRACYVDTLALAHMLVLHIFNAITFEWIFSIFNNHNNNKLQYSNKSLKVSRYAIDNQKKAFCGIFFLQESKR